MTRVRIVRNTVVSAGRDATAGQVLDVEPLTAAALLDARAAELVSPADLAAVTKAQERENFRVCSAARHGEPWQARY